MLKIVHVYEPTSVYKLTDGELEHFCEETERKAIQNTK